MTARLPNDRMVPGLIVVVGISSMVTQLITIREFLAQFQGNEFIIALIFFVWLVLGGMGVLLAGLVHKTSFRPRMDHLALLSLVLASLPTIEILAIRGLRDLVFLHGSSVGFYPTFAFIFTILAPYGLLLGLVLPFAIFVLREQTPDYPATRIYLADVLGNTAGALLFSFVLVHLVTPLKALFLSGLPILAAVFSLLPPRPGRRLRPFLGVGLVFGVLLVGVFLEPISLAPVNGRLVYYQESRYGRIEVQEEDGQNTLFVDGMPFSSNENIAMAEEAVHYPLSQVQDPRHILLISGQGGILKELQKYRPQTIDYVELDPVMSDVQFRFGLQEKIPGLTILHEDGREYLAGSAKIYDAIIVNLPPPETFQVNRFFTDRFFSLARSHLSLKGVFSFAVEGFDNYLSEPQRQGLSSLYNTVTEHFSEVLLLPGERIYFLCRNQPIAVDIPELLAQKGIPTDYVSSLFYGNLTEERINYVLDLLDPTTPKNRDASPGLMRIVFNQWFSKFATSPLFFFAMTGLILSIYLLWMKQEEFVLFSTGWITMSSEILVIFTFEIFFGYIYSAIGLLVTVFLAGLLPGAWLGERLRRKDRRILALTDVLLILLMAVFWVALNQGGDLLPRAGLLLFGFLVSGLCGFQLPLVLMLQGGGASAVTRTFSADLIGAAFGTLLTSAVLIPYCGLLGTTLILIGLKIVSLVMVTNGKKGRHRGTE